MSLPALAEVGLLRLGAPALGGAGRLAVASVLSLSSHSLHLGFCCSPACCLLCLLKQLTHRCLCLPCSHTCHAHSDGTCTSFGLSAWIVVFAGIQICLAQVGALMHSASQTKHRKRSTLVCPGLLFVL